ncbi:hypothetical protein WOLCODRAFT_136838 [Wolfiporia cocos MD-104 SS10]|uniref:Uncharacterized protein n=1 Tax=Wolfiporia cocos (strain MD-104) TaxID=742152 RepID=A0A2H3JDV2_WOLCO|nr:hypothetical protein WOLCODRAFT_136838 [Wolfiporia cocos MD-104 SS10]
MLFKLSALAALLPFASAQFAYLFNTPVGWVSGQPANVSWTVDPVGDPATFTILLGHWNETTNQQDSWVLASYVDSYALFDSFTLPDVPAASNYFLLPMSNTLKGAEAPQSAYFGIAAQ